MSEVIARAERTLGRDLAVYWVDNGAGDVFALTDVEPCVVTFCARTVELSGWVRALLTSDWMSEEIRSEVAESVVYQVVAERAAQRGDTDLAAMAITRALSTTGMRLLPPTIMTLEHEPIGEPYMAIWFYALCHELGHLAALGEVARTRLADDQVWERLRSEAANFRFGSEVLLDAVDAAEAGVGPGLLRADHLRTEACADLMATFLLAESTEAIMQELGERMRAEVFVQELVIALNIVGVLDRCRRVADEASRTRSSRELVLDMLASPLALRVRAHAQRWALEAVLSNWPNISDLIDGVIEGLIPRIESFEVGMARAMELLLNPESWPLDWEIVDEFRSAIATGSAIAEARPLLMRASDRGSSQLLSALLDVADDPGGAVPSDVMGDVPYFVPWVNGPNDYSQPFSLETRYGRLCFVFTEADEVYAEFFRISAEALAPGYSLARAMVLSPRPEQVGATINRHAELRNRLGFVVQGTSSFDDLFEELMDDTIWPEAESNL